MLYLSIQIYLITKAYLWVNLNPALNKLVEKIKFYHTFVTQIVIFYFERDRKETIDIL